MKSFLTFDTKQQTTDWQRLFVPNPDISNSYDVDKLIWLMMVFFTYLHEVLQAKFSHDGSFTNKTSCPFLTSRRFVRIPWPTNQDLTWSTNATNINNVGSFFSSLHNLHLFQALPARQGHLWTLMPKVKLPIKQKMSGFELRLPFHEFLIFWFDWVSTFCHLHFTGPILTVD